MFIPFILNNTRSNYFDGKAIYFFKTKSIGSLVVDYLTMILQTLLSEWSEKKKFKFYVGEKPIHLPWKTFFHLLFDIRSIKATHFMKQFTEHLALVKIPPMPVTLGVSSFVAS